MATIAEQLAEVLVQADVRQIHGAVGDSSSSVVDAARRSPVDRVSVRNQEARASAASAGVPSGRADGPGDVRGTLATAPAAEGPYRLAVVTDPDALSLPPHATADQVRGSALTAGEVVPTGGVGTMSEPARSNLRNLTTL
jgi:thiamine pyrophosphate-dependent acetolactate synthase large subunit-like protein